MTNRQKAGIKKRSKKRERRRESLSAWQKIQKDTMSSGYFIEPDELGILRRCYKRQKGL